MKFSSFMKEDHGRASSPHEQLNPKLWENDELKPEVAKALLRIAGKFIETLKLPMEAVRDIVFTGSNCAYTYTNLSDADVHIEVDKGLLADCEDCKIDAEDCLQAKKTLWNEQHDIEVLGIPVEMYATSVIQDLIAGSGAYSLVKKVWLQRPKKEGSSWSREQVLSKAKPLEVEIDQLIASDANDEAALTDLHAKIMRMRQSGLKEGGELSLENLVFKALRDAGYIRKLRDQIQKAEDDDLSLKAH